MVERLANNASSTGAGGPAATAAGAPPPAMIPDWLVNVAALGWRILAIAGLLVILFWLGTVLWTITASIAVAVVIAAAFAPFALRLRARGRSRTAAAGIVWLVALAVVGGLLVLVALVLLPYGADLVARIGSGVAEMQARLAEAGTSSAVSAAIEAAVQTVRDALGATVVGIVSSAAGVVTVAILAAFLVFFFLQDGDKAWVWIFQAVSDQKRERITAAGDDALTRVGGYLRGTTVLSGIIALTDLVFMLILGVPLAVPLSVLVFLFGYIPYFGGIVTTAVILLVTYGALGTGPVVAMVALILVRNAILGYGIRPMIYGRALSIHPAVVLIVLPAGFQLAGVVGLFAAVPVTAVVLAVASAVVTIIDPGPRPELPALVPPWLDRLAQWSWRLLVGIGLLALLVVMVGTVPFVMIPLILGTILAATLSPLVQRLVRRGWSPTRASIVATGGSFLAITVIIVLTLVSVVTQASDLAGTAASGAGSVSSAGSDALGLLVEAVRQGGFELVQAAQAVASALGAVAINAVLSVMLAYYFLRDGGRLWQLVLARIRPGAAEPLDAAGREAFAVLSGYMFGTGAVSLVGATSQLFIMWVLGLPLLLPVFVLSFLLCFIPYIGGFISTGLALLIAIAVGSPTDVAVMAVFTLVFNIVQGNIVAPLVYGRTVRLHPAVVLVACPAGAAVAGLAGMFLVVPFAGIIAATWRTALRVAGMPKEAGDPSAQVESPAGIAAPVTRAPAPAEAPSPG